MKKILIILVSFLYINYVNSAEDIQLNSKQKIYYVLHKINENLDNVLTVKSAAKAAISLAPLFILYCYCFETSPIQEIINKIIRYISKSQESYNIQKTIGQTQAYWEYVYKYPLEKGSEVMLKLLDKTLYTALPILLGLIAKSQLGIG